MIAWFETECRRNTPNANMADHSVVARDEYESEASEASVFCFDKRELKQEDFSRRRRGEVREGLGLTSSFASQI